MPASLVEWHCCVTFPHKLKAGPFINRIRVLSLGELPQNCTVQELLKLAPLLEDLSVAMWGTPTSTQTELMWKDCITYAELTPLKTRLLKAFHLSCYTVCFTGPGLSIRDMQSLLSPLESTSACFIHLTGNVHPSDCLYKLAHSCPSIKYLYFGETTRRWAHAPWVGENFIASVSGCVHLRRLDVNFPVFFTNKGLVRLCMGLPALRSVYLQPCARLGLVAAMKELASQGRVVKIVVKTEGREPPALYAH